MAFARPHALVMVTPDDPAYECKPSDWNTNHTPTGADVGGIPYCPTATTETTSPYLIFSFATRSILALGSATAGANLGMKFATGQYGGGIFAYTVTPSDTNYSFLTDGTTTYLQATNDIYLQTNQVSKVRINSTAGYGAVISAGTATTDVNALSATQTWNASGVAFTAEKTTVTMTAFHADSLVRDWRNASASLFAIHNTGAFGGVGTTYANRPSAPWTGTIHNITDSNTATWGATIAGGGANNVLARYNGTNWTVVGV